MLAEGCDRSAQVKTDAESENPMNRITLESGEIESIDGLLAEVMTRYSSPEGDDFLKDAPVLAHELPRRVRFFLNDFRCLEPASGTCLISGYPVDEARIGRTPQHWKDRPAVSPTVREEMLLILFGTLLGDPIAWVTQQNGHIVHDIMPIKEDEYEQLGTGSQQTLWWHNEDAFHPCRGDHLGMMCLRNPDLVETTIASVDSVRLTPEQVEALFTPHYVIRPDESHTLKNRADTSMQQGIPAEVLRSSYERIERMNSSPEKIAVLYGDPASPYIRLDPYFMNPVADEKAQQALDALSQAVDAALVGVALRPGDFLFIDNYKAVHGRKPFKARFDGTDRWLKRINVTKDLRKSRGWRVSCRSRVIC